MKFRLRILTMAAAMIAPSAVFAQNPPAVVGRANQRSLEQDGNLMVRRAAEQLLRQPALEAKIRQRADLFGQQLVGSGSYQQLGDSGGNVQFRLELKLQAAGEVTSVQHVYDGRFLWIRSNLPRRKELSRIDLRKIREAETAAGAANPQSPTSGNWMKLGGLPRLLQGLHDHFTFAAPRADQIGPIPVWIVEGAWRPAPSESGGAESELPPRAPDSVILILGRDDVTPLFPYRVEFRRRVDDASAGDSPVGRPASKSIVTLELFEVQIRAQLDPASFTYTPGDQKVNDLTEAYLQSLGLASEKIRQAGGTDNGLDRR